MTVIEAFKELVHGSRFSAETVHAEAGKVGRSLVASVLACRIVQPSVYSLHTSHMIALLL